MYVMMNDMYVMTCAVASLLIGANHSHALLWIWLAAELQRPGGTANQNTTQMNNRNDIVDHLPSQNWGGQTVADYRDWVRCCVIHASQHAYSLHLIITRLTWQSPKQPRKYITVACLQLLINACVQ